MISLDRDSSVPLVNQICDGVIDAIARQVFIAGAKLPSVRRLADQLAVSSFTIASAYDRLSGLGIIQSRRGSGYYVMPPAKRPSAPATRAITTDDLPSSGSVSVDFFREALNTRHFALPVSCGFLPPSWIGDALSPVVTGKLMRQAFMQGEPAAIAGGEVLRERLAQRLRELGLTADASRVLITSGATHSFYLIVQTLLSPEDVVVVEDPSYFLLQMRRSDARISARMMSVPRKEDGPDLDALEALCKTHRPKLILTQTLAHNPLGGNTSMAVGHRLLRLAEEYDFYIIEDDIFGDLAGKDRFYLSQLNGSGTKQRVFYISSFSKTLSASVRVGFMLAPPELMSPLLETKVATVLSGSLLDETLVQHVLESGRFQRHTEKLRERVWQARAKTVQALKKMGVMENDPPQDGLFLWAKMPDGVDVPALIDEARQRSIFLCSGDIFSQKPGAERYLRLNVSYACQPAFLEWLAGVVAQS
ncbi:PLP-dependent aminotransferase family protein [Pokkaliibacter sp. CJK22405]|uniref:aminotransferase-like domain-containing protein n=1 Tax=Pokkaliibacter sp. CJK22405 TaxID=3384615 RepID=UPI003984DE0A